MANQIPEKYHLGVPRKIEGDAAVSYPYGTEHRRVERSFTVPRNTDPKNYKALDEQYASTKLVQRARIGGDQQYVLIYEAYEDLPGAVITELVEDANHGPVMRTTQKVFVTGTEVPGSVVVDDPNGTRTITTYAPIGDQAGCYTKVVEQYKKNGEILRWKEAPDRFGIVRRGIEYIEDFVDPAVGAEALAISGAEVSTLDLRSSRVRIPNYEDLSDQLSALSRTREVRRPLRLPRVLVGVFVSWSVNQGSGSSTGSEPTGEIHTTQFSISASRPSRSSGSVSITPEVVPIMKGFGDLSRVRFQRYELSMIGDYTEADIRSKLSGDEYADATVNEWPLFRTQSTIICATGAQVSQSANADASANLDYNSGIVKLIKGKTEGYSGEAGSNSSKVVIDDCIHPEIIISPSTYSQDLDVDASVSVTLGGILTTPFTANANNPTVTATGTISPTKLFATTPASLPSSGLYLVDYDQQEYDSANDIITAYVLDASLIAGCTIFAGASPANFGTVAGGGDFAPGASVSLIATVAPGKTFVNWTKNGVSVSGSSVYNFTATADGVYVANFS